MKQHKVELSKTHNLIDAVSQCVDFIEGEYGKRPSVLKHHNLDLIKSSAFSALDKVMRDRAKIQKIYGMDVVYDPKLKPDEFLICTIDERGKSKECVRIKTPKHDSRS